MVRRRYERAPLGAVVVGVLCSAVSQGQPPPENEYRIFSVRAPNVTVNETEGQNASTNPGWWGDDPHASVWLWAQVSRHPAYSESKAHIRCEPYSYTRGVEWHGPDPVPQEPRTVTYSGEVHVAPCVCLEIHHLKDKAQGEAHGAATGKVTWFDEDLVVQDKTLFPTDPYPIRTISLSVPTPGGLLAAGDLQQANASYNTEPVTFRQKSYVRLELTVTAYARRYNSPFGGDTSAWAEGPSGGTIEIAGW